MLAGNSQYTGYLREVKALARELRILPEELTELPPTTEDEFVSRFAGEMPEEAAPALRPPVRFR